MKVGDRVHQRCNPEHRGTVVAVLADGFVVAYDSTHADYRRVAGGRYEYPSTARQNFQIGNPSAD